jgi:hypothetical protein
MADFKASLPDPSPAPELNAPFETEWEQMVSALLGGGKA